MIFVFGSNLAGRHGRGAAAYARKHYGAIYGQGAGRQGHSYAIPTKGTNFKPLTIGQIRPYVNQFIAYARAHPALRFELTAIGCGLAGYKPEQIAPLFHDAPSNVTLPKAFRGLT